MGPREARPDRCRRCIGPASTSAAQWYAAPACRQDPPGRSRAHGAGRWHLSCLTGPPFLQTSSDLLGVAILGGGIRITCDAAFLLSPVIGRGIIGAEGHRLELSPPGHWTPEAIPRAVHMSCEPI